MREVVILSEELARLGENPTEIEFIGPWKPDMSPWIIVRDSSHDCPTLMEDQDSDLESHENAIPEA